MLNAKNHVFPIKVVESPKTTPEGFFFEHLHKVPSSRLQVPAVEKGSPGKEELQSHLSDWAGMYKAKSRVKTPALLHSAGAGESLSPHKDQTSVSHAGKGSCAFWSVLHEPFVPITLDTELKAVSFRWWRERESQSPTPFYQYCCWESWGICSYSTEAALQQSKLCNPFIMDCSQFLS